MPSPGALTGTMIDTGSLFQDTVDNVHQLILEHLDDLKFESKELVERCVVKYDDITPYHTPFLSIVFESARISDEKINKCYTWAIDLVLYYYMNSLSFGNDTHPFLSPLYRLAEIFIVHPQLYGNFAYRTEIREASLIYRRLDTDVLLTGQVSLTFLIRACGNDHS